MAHRLQGSSDRRVSETGDRLNAALRAARRAAGLSLDVLAARTNFSKSYLGNVEAGRRRVTAEIAAAYDTAIGTGGLLGRMLADEPVGLVGRAAELARLRELVVEVVAGRGRALWVEGEPGIGKSALLTTGLAGAGPAGCRVLWAAADESLARFPLWVLLAGLSGHPDPELVQLTAVLEGDDAGAPAVGDAVLAAAERLVLLVERWCAAGPVLLVIDDLQWADEVSLSVWGRLRRLVSQVPLLLVGSCRPVPRRPEVAALRRGVGGPDGVGLHLAPLDPAGVTERTGALAGAPAGPPPRAGGARAEAGAGVEVVAEQLLAGGDRHGTDGWAAKWLAGAAGTLVNRAPQAALELIERVPDGTWPQLAGYRVAALSLLARDEDVARSGPAVLAQTADAETIGRTGWTLAYSLGRLGRFAQARGVLDGILRGGGLEPTLRARLLAYHAVLATYLAHTPLCMAEAERGGVRLATDT